jgi:hypothetical protein
MKTTRLILSTAILMFTLMFQSCEKTDLDKTNENGILPERFKIDIPSSISNDTKVKSSLLKSAQGDTIKGNEIYQLLNLFVAVGEGAGDIVQGIIGAIVIYHIDKPMTVTYVSNDDNRTKNIVVIENAAYAGKSYEYELTITDALSEGNADGGKALQIFWNRSPISGVAIVKPYNCNRVKDGNNPNAILRIEYSEEGTAEYDSYMIVDIDGLPLADPKSDQFSISTLKMFVGKKGDIVDVYGNSNHPNAKFFTQQTGFNWAFVASGNDKEDYAVAEVGLPPSTLDNSTRKVLLGDYSIKNVLTEQINEWFFLTFGIHPDANDLSNYLKNADAPGFFSNSGFVQAGTSPDAKYSTLVTRISNLAPYNPKLINDLTIDFK